jgi:alpha/beta superfamily hydrolase
MQDRDLHDQRLTIPNGAAGLNAKLSLAHPGRPLLILAHGFAGNKDENGLFTAARDYFGGCDFSVLRFDFRGCGENDDSFRTVRLVDLQSDLEAVVAFARSSVPHSGLGLVSFSLASAVSILVNPRVKAQVFWSPAIYTDRDMYARHQTDEILDSIQNRGYFVKAALAACGASLDA